MYCRVSCPLPSHGLKKIFYLLENYLKYFDDDKLAPRWAIVALWATCLVHNFEFQYLDYFLDNFWGPFLRSKRCLVYIWPAMSLWAPLYDRAENARFSMVILQQKIAR